jgi:hypothetical protein
LRRTCPACQRRYGGLVDPECPVCTGIGTVGLGAAALHTAAPEAVARAVELYLEEATRRAGHPTERADVVDAAVLELRTAGVIASPSDGAGPPATSTDPATASLAELDAHLLATRLGAKPTAEALTALASDPVELVDAREPGALHPHASANGDRAHLTLALDPIEPLGPDLNDLSARRVRHEHQARVITAAAHHLATKPARSKATR